MEWAEIFGAEGTEWLILMAILFVGVLFWAFRSNKRR